MECQRCHQKTGSWSTSYYESKDICPNCKQEESTSPHFAVARQVENEHVRTGNFNYPGVWEQADPRYTVDMQREDRNHQFEQLCNRPGIVISPPKKKQA